MPSLKVKYKNMIPYSINIIWSEEDEAYSATIPELPGLTAFGDTQLEVVQEATEIAKEMIDSY